MHTASLVLCLTTAAMQEVLIPHQPVRLTRWVRTCHRAEPSCTLPARLSLHNQSAFTSAQLLATEQQKWSKDPASGWPQHSRAVRRLASLALHTWTMEWHCTSSAFSSPDKCGQQMRAPTKTLALFGAHRAPMCAHLAPVAAACHRQYDMQALQ